MDKNLNDYDRAALEEVRNPDIIARPSILAALKEYFIGLMGMGVGLYFLQMIPEKGVWVHKLLHLNFKFLRVHIPYEYMAYPLYGLISIFFLYALYFFLYQKTFVVSVSTRHLIIRQGVLGEDEDQTDLENITDCDTRRSPIDRLLGLRTVSIEVKREKNRKILKGFRNMLALDLADYIRANSYESYTQYRVSRDRQKESVKRKDASDLDDRLEYDEAGALVEERQRRSEMKEKDFDQDLE